jgi:uncharacterized membrane protein
MIDSYLVLKFIHVLGATVLFGTGLGIAFFMWMAHRSRDPAFIAQTGRVVVIADATFTMSAVLVQPLTGFALVYIVGYSVFESWVVSSLVLYVLVGACWLPVVWIQMQLRRLAEESVRRNGTLPQSYHRLFRIWFILGWPAFIGVVLIFALMIWRPQLW